MRDESFHLDAAAREAAPPFSYRFIDRPWPAHGWSIRAGDNAQVGTARTRAGARQAIRALYGSASWAHSQPMPDFEDHDDSDDCPNCGGSGYVASCFEEWACIDPESGCDLCTHRCDWCNRPTPPKAEGEQ